MFYVSAGMPRAGSGWFYNIMHDIVVALGGDDAREVRRRFFLQPVLTEVNCNIRMLSDHRVALVGVPVLLGRRFVIKTHSGPRQLARWLITHGRMKVAYIYRDPRDAALSAYEYGKRMREAGRPNAFSHLETIEQALEFMVPYLRIWEEWMALPQVHKVRYEDLRSDFDREVERLAAFLGMPANHPGLAEIRQRYRPGVESDHQGLHFYKGQVARHRQVFTPEQLALAQRLFGKYLPRMGYK